MSTEHYRFDFHVFGLVKALPCSLFSDWLSLSSTRSVISLVPRPFPPPVFGRILKEKMEGEGLGERVTCVMSGRREGGGARSL